MSAKSELIDATWNPRLVKTPVPIMFAITRFVAVMTEIFLRLIESGNSLLVIRGSADLSMEKNTEFGQDVKWKDGRMGHIRGAEGPAPSRARSDFDSRYWLGGLQSLAAAGADIVSKAIRG